LLSVVLANIRDLPIAFGYDFQYYREVGARWVADGAYYWPHQLAGPYEFTIMVDNLYPPLALLLFAPFVYVPSLLWWLIPAAIVGYALRSWRPGRWVVATMLVILCWQKAHIAWIYGSTDIWAMAAVAGGLKWGWPSVLILLKPTLAPFALVGARKRSWWVALALLALVSLAMLPLWIEYFTAMRNLRVEATYSLHSFPLLVVPVVAWLARPSHKATG
jgi:branched-subunit amino acid transport protein AzlD